MNNEKELYLSEINQELDNYSYKERYLKELSDHYDDYQCNLQLSGKDDNHDDISNELGKCKYLADNFNHIMEKIYKPHLIRDIIIINIISVLVFVFSYFLSIGLDDVISRSDIDLINHNFGWLSMLIQVIIISIFYFIISVNFQNSLITVKNELHRKIIFYILATPIILLLFHFVVGLVLFSMFDAIISVKTHDLPIAEIINNIVLPESAVVLKYILLIIINYYIIAKTWQLNQVRQLNKNIIIKTATYSIYVVVFLWLIIYFLAPYLFYSGLYLNMGHISLLGFPILLNFILNVIFTILFGIIFNVLIAQWALIAIYSVAALLSVFHIMGFIKKRIIKNSHYNFPGLALLLCIFTLGSLFFPPVFEINNIDFNVANNHVSEKIVHSQFSIFAKFINYINADEGKAFYYSVSQGSDKSNFIIDQNSGKRFILTGIKNVNDYQLIKQAKVDNKLMDWTSAYSGFDNSRVNCIISDINWIPENHLEAPRACSMLYVNDRLIYSTGDGWPQLNNILISEDNNWALLHFNNGAYDTSDVYLVELK
ncbi:MAG: hypothetical protein V1898_02455 [Patescibacteria group bacterium]